MSGHVVVFAMSGERRPPAARAGGGGGRGILGSETFKRVSFSSRFSELLFADAVSFK
ncbi:hypothetical protein AMP9_3160 [plant metagenome]|uniref:Uncharacterized protein n=1 Tax=plant metagenome TaxID=1297885 RepID=A0A484NXG2_9ZZZZ